MSKLTGIIAFATGAAAGAAASWYFAKTKYERIAQEEIDSVKEAFNAPCEDHGPEPTEDKEDEEEDHPELSEKEYTAVVNDHGYTAYSDAEQKEVESMGFRKPYVIPPEEFGEEEEYGRSSLTYYADKVLVDELDEMVENVEDTIGFESLTHFGEYEEDSVYVRNERIKCDFEILLDSRRYTDVLKEKPYKESFYDSWANE